MGARLKAQVRRRARFRCEYCQFSERFAELPFQVDRVIARQHGGPTRIANLALAVLSVEVGPVIWHNHDHQGRLLPKSSK